MRSIPPHFTALITFALSIVSHRVNAEDSTRHAAESKPLAWKRIIHLHDGRTLVSDGAIALDLGLVKPAERPKEDLAEANAKVIEGYLNAQLTEEYALSQLTWRGEAYAAPNGVTLNPTYMEYLRRNLPEGQVRLRMKGVMDSSICRAVGYPRDHDVRWVPKVTG